MEEEKIKPDIVKGMHDRMPEEMRKREKVIGSIKSIFELSGFLPIETPAIEYWDVLSGKNRYGDEEKLIYHFKDRKGRDVGLRFDFTIPLSRVVAMHPDIPIPFKRYQIQPVWRGDAPQYGRFREFYQCDVDIVGAQSMLAEAEILSITYEVFKTLGFKDFKIKINNRKILQSLCEYSGIPQELEFNVYRAMDKHERIGTDGVAEKLQLNGVSRDACEKLVGLLEDCKTLKSLERTISGNEGIQELASLFDYLKDFNINRKFFSFDPWLARGLDYYTGPIFETVVPRPKIGSLAGGGRFDNLIGVFLEKPIPAVGITIGLERIMIAIKELNLISIDKLSTRILVAQFDESHSTPAIIVAKKLRDANIPTEIYPDFVKLSKQFKYADKQKIPYVIVVGPDEMRAQKVTIKNMRTGKQQEMKMDKLPTWARKLSVKPNDD